MRDRESDSWWSIMTSNAIGGPMAGAELVELPISEKATWADWSSRHPNTLVLSVDGQEHVADDPYAEYFASDETFEQLVVDDDRLPAKEPIYSFLLDGEPQAVPHASFEGGKLFALGGGRRLFLYRAAGASMFASSRAWLVDSPGLSGVSDPAEILALLERSDAQSASRLAGFDTFWYSWVAIHDSTRLIR